MLSSLIVALLIFLIMSNQKLIYMYYLYDITQLVFNSNMQELLQDPETLPFKQNRNINLGILKKEINRRVIKIKSMLGYNLSEGKNKVNNFGCQTQNIQLNGQTFDNLKNVSVLSKQKSTIKLLVQTNDKSLKYTGRCSLPVRKLNDRKNQQNQLRKSTRVRVSQYLQTAKIQNTSALILRNTQEKENNINKQLIKYEQPQKDYLDLFNPFKHSKKKSQIYIDKGDYSQFNELFLFRSPDQNFHQVQLSSQCSDLQPIRSNFTATKGLKKMKFTERTALQQQKRYCLTEDTIQKVNNEIYKLIVKKRREAQDNKLRQNIFKKIEEKYGEYFDNI